MWVSLPTPRPMAPGYLDSFLISPSFTDHAVDFVVMPAEWVLFLALIVLPVGAHLPPPGLEGKSVSGPVTAGADWDQALQGPPRCRKSRNASLLSCWLELGFEESRPPL